MKKVYQSVRQAILDLSEGKASPGAFWVKMFFFVISIILLVNFFLNRAWLQ